MAEDPFDAFGSDSDTDNDEVENDSNENEEQQLAQSIATSLTTILLSENSEIELAHRNIWVGGGVDSRAPCIVQALESRGFHVVVGGGEDEPERIIIDVVIDMKRPDEEFIMARMVPGGHYFLLTTTTTPMTNDDEDVVVVDPIVWRRIGQPQTPIININKNSGTNNSSNVVVYHFQLHPCPIQRRTCPWLPTSHKIEKELDLLRQATVAMSAHERQRRLTRHSIGKAVRKLQECGYCILPQLLDPVHSRQWGQVVLDDLHQAATILLERDNVDILNPHNDNNNNNNNDSNNNSIKKDPASYRELSMREDLRVDIRHGPKLKAKRGSKRGNQPWQVTATTQLTDDDSDFLRGNADILEIVRTVMNPKVSEQLSAGNFGRHNFDGSGPDGSFQNLTVGIVGGIVSLPGSADQALHADTPHLFEHTTLPAHYINAFTPGCERHENVGQTALVHGSHRLEFTAQYCGGDTIHPELWDSLVRPSLNLGDVLLFDCRILHFGLANTTSSSAKIERPLLYTNMTMHWFHDPKNWDDQERIFDDGVDEDDNSQ